MSNLTVDGDSDYTTTGNPDTFTVVSDGPSGTEAVAAHINGIARAIIELQALIGNANTLKGTVADLVTRLSRVIHEDGALAKGTAFPGTPIDGQPFYRTDLNVLYVYDAGSTSWTVGVDTGDFVRVDGTREMTGDLKIKKALPSLRLKGTEGSGQDVYIQENAGVLIFYDNTGTEGTPVLTERCRISMATGEVVAKGDVSSSRIKLTGSGSVLGIFTHANTAERTYTLPDASIGIDAGVDYKGPTSTGASSTRSHEGDVTISANQSLNGIHFYTNFTLDASKTLTIDNDVDRLVIVASGTITINGTINGAGAGSPGGVGAVISVGAAGANGFTQPGGGGGSTQDGSADGGNGGATLMHGVVRVSGGNGGTGGGAGSGGSSQSGAALMIDHPFAMLGGAGGGAGGGGGGGAQPAGGNGGRGGGSIVLVAPTIVLGASSVLNTSGAAGANGGDATLNDSGGGGGGGAGNVYILCRTYIDNGCTFTVAGGAGGTNGGFGGGAGGAGANGVRQILIHS